MDRSVGQSLLLTNCPLSASLQSLEEVCSICTVHPSGLSNRDGSDEKNIQNVCKEKKGKNHRTEYSTLAVQAQGHVNMYMYIPGKDMLRF